MGIMDFLLDAWDDTKKFDPLGHKALETVAKQDSRTMSSLGNKLGWQWLENQANENVADPRRAIAHGSLGAAAWFGGPWLASLGGGGGAAAANAGRAGMAASALESGAPALAAGGEGALSAAQLQILAAQQAAMQQAAEQAAAQGTLSTGGLFGSGVTNAATQVPSGLSSGGLFSQIPGVSSGSQQAAYLAAQNEGMGGTAADLTAKAAMPAVKDAYAAGQMSLPSYLGNVASADMAGMNDPAVWLSRLSANAGRFAGTASKNAASSMLKNALMPQQPQYRPQPLQRQQPVQIPQVLSPQDQALQDFQAGKISAEELRRRLGVLA